MDRLKKYLLTFGFIIIIFTFSIGTFSSVDKLDSDMEKRELKQLPYFTWENVFSGEVFDDFDGFLSDHIFLRDDMIRFYCDYNVNILGKKNLQGVTIGKGNQLFETLPLNSSYFKSKEVLESEADLLENIRKVDLKCKSRGIKFYFVYAPRKSHMLFDEYPARYYSSRKELVKLEKKIADFCGNDIGFINLRSTLEPDAKNNYFKSDHHWNMRGSFLAYQTMISTIKKDIPQVGEPFRAEDFEFVKYGDFTGIENRFLYHVVDTYDTLELPVPKNGWIPYRKFQNGVRYDDIYNMEQLQEADDFDIFMNGNKGSVVFNTSRPDKKDLLIFGDSYTNCVEPYLFQNFNKTRILDLRNYHRMALDQYIDTYQPDVVLWLVNSLGVTQGGPNIDLKNIK